MEIKNYFAQDAQGNIMPSANCYLYLPGTTTLATGLVDGSGTPISNPFLASSVGQVEFGAPNGVYDLRVALGARDWTIKVQCADIAQAMDVMDSILGSHAENPATRNNGQPLEPGDETWNSTDKQPYWWNGTGWVALNSSAQQLEERIRDAINPANGAGMEGYKGRYSFDRLSEKLSIKDAPFSAKLDGSDEGQIVQAFYSYCATVGAHGVIPGDVNMGTTRVQLSTAAGHIKPFKITGKGGRLSRITFKNVSPVLNAGGTAVVTREPNLFEFNGLSGVTPFPYFHIEGFFTDYSDQLFKGGASATTPDLTDIKPLSNGVNWITVNYGSGCTLIDLVGSEIYGNGIILSRCPHSSIKNVRGFNVSGGNPGSGDSSGGFIGIMRGSQVGTDVSGCVAINTRTYKTDTIGGFNNITAKDTPCGYIGIWTEYGTIVGGIKSPGSDLWNSKAPENRESFGCSICGNYVFGYTLGFKNESYSPTFLSRNVAVGCWIPFIAGATRGRITSCYADCGELDGKVCPQSGYQHVRGLYVHYNINGQPYDYSGLTYDGCISYTRNTRVFVTNTDNGNFLNQQTIIDHTDVTKDDPQVFTTRAGYTMSGSKVSGTVVIKSLGKAMSSVIFDMQQLVLDLNIINLASFVYTINPAKFQTNGGCNDSDIRVRSTGLVRLGLGSSRDCRMYYSGVMTDVTKAYTTLPVYADGGCDGCDITVDLTLHSASVPTAQFGVVSVQGNNSCVDISLTVVDAGSNTLDSILFSNAKQTNVRSIRKYDDVYKIPLIKPGTSGGSYHVAQAFSNDRGPLFAANYGLRGPITLGSQLSYGDLAQSAIAYEPNARDRIVKDVIDYPAGLTIPYLKPALGGREGLKVRVGGRVSSAWVASTAVAVGVYRSTAAGVYRAIIAGTTGTVAPTHASGSAEDGTVTWLWISPKAALPEYGSIAATDE